MKSSRLTAQILTKVIALKIGQCFASGHQPTARALNAAREALPRLTLSATRQGFPPLYLRPAAWSAGSTAVTGLQRAAQK